MGMDENQRTAWPSSWPPVWRTILHIAIATGVSNVAPVALMWAVPVVAFRARSLRYLVFAAALILLPLLPSLIPCLLSRANAKMTSALLQVVYVSYAIAVAGFLVSQCLCNGLPIASRPTSLAVAATSILAVAATCWVFATTIGLNRPRAVWTIVGIGSALMVLAWLHAIVLSHMLRPYTMPLVGTYVGGLLCAIGIVNPFDLAVATTSALLIRAAQVHATSQPSPRTNG